MRRPRSEQGHQQQVLRTLAELSLKGEAFIGGGEWNDGGELLLLLIIIIQSWEGYVCKSISSACPTKECIRRDFLVSATTPCKKETKNSPSLYLFLEHKKITFVEGV